MKEYPTPPYNDDPLFKKWRHQVAGRARKYISVMWPPFLFFFLLFFFFRLVGG